MDVEIFYKPVFHIVIDNVLDEKELKLVLDEIVDNKDNFNDAKTGNGTDSKFDYLRNNTVAFYDRIYKDKRHTSELLKAIGNIFQNDMFISMLSSSPQPFNNFVNTNTHETQVSRYGDNSQKYDWHIDSKGNYARQITMVLYLHNTPKKFTGGEINISSSPLYDGKLLDNNAIIKTIEPKNNRCVIFNSTVSHMVSPTKSSKKFEDGRFSVNCWIGNI